ncbi:OmpA family protein [Acetobacter sp.]|jgi:outer membrane protein OmpA-like peptidoglycan-associated protein|uniref:OmpA family protein n=1 Tax=Acetobacter sp. TaxID=440 RepID=UPI0025BDDC29|nr:OmpA family protein [Acetobacter sp.]MCH4089735.1 OmpA family protein [Acetobacter sp.]MCI1298431.1 OmpA family protein [Acetobacter sp.]MCI1316386.1 OmpA family protein [Acetobacter sp.]
MRRLLSVISLCALAACAGEGPGRQYVVFFGQGSAELDDVSQSVVTKIAAKARHYSDRVVVVEGYARQNGDLSAESLLAVLRAKAVARQLVADGVAEGRIRETTRPPSNAEGVVGSRRVEIELLAQ